MKFAAAALALVAAAPSVLAGVYITNPVESTTVNGGSTITVKWEDNGEKPTLKDVGLIDIAIFTGSVQQQTLLQTLQTNVNAETVGEVQATVDPSIGPNGNVYFIRFQSKSLKDPENDQYQYQAYSAKFTLNNMSGEFSDEVKKQLADIAAAESTSAASASKTAAATKSSSTAASTTKADAAAANATESPTSGAGSLALPAFGAVFAGVLAVLAL